MGSFFMAFIILLLSFSLCFSQSCYNSKTDWNHVVYVSKTTTTLQGTLTLSTNNIVLYHICSTRLYLFFYCRKLNFFDNFIVVANPLLNPLTSPVASKAWQSLANLNANLVRFLFSFFLRTECPPIQSNNSSFHLIFFVNLDQICPVVPLPISGRS